MSIVNPSARSLVVLTLSSPRTEECAFLTPEVMSAPVIVRLVKIFSVIPGVLMTSLHRLLSDGVEQMMRFEHRPNSLGTVLPAQPVPGETVSVPPGLSVHYSCEQRCSEVMSLTVIPSKIGAFYLSVSA